MSLSSDRPLVSICIPTYNRSSRLERAVRSSIASTHLNIEIIISDNGSSDDTKQVCEKLSKLDSRIKCIHHCKNRGAGWNFEYVRNQAKGKYFIWLGDDDHMDSELIERCVMALESDDSLILAAGVGAYHRGDGNTVFTGNIIQLSSNFALFRVLGYIFRMEDNSIFCGVYNREKVSQYVPPSIFAGDSVWMGEILFEGKAVVLEAVQLHRELWDSGSASPEKMVASVGGPAWQGRYPWIAVPFNVARGIAYGAQSLRQRGALSRHTIALLIFVTSFTKQVILILTPKIPGGRWLYRWYFKSDIDKISRAMQKTVDKSTLPGV